MNIGLRILVYIAAITVSCAAAAAKPLDTTIADITKAATSFAVIAADQFNEEEHLALNEDAWSSYPFRAVPGAKEVLSVRNSVLRGSDGKALRIDIYHRGNDVVMVGILIAIDVGTKNYERTMNTIKAVTDASIKNQAGIGNWIDEAIAESSRLLSEGHRAITEGRDIPEAGYWPVVQKTFGDTRVALFAGELCGVIILPR